MFLNWGLSQFPAWEWGLWEIRRKMREKCQCMQNTMMQGCNWWSQRADVPGVVGMFTQRSFLIKVPYSKVSLVGSWPNYTSKLLEWHMFGPLVPTPEGLPVGTGEIFYSPWCSGMTRSWLSLTWTVVAQGMQWVLEEHPTACRAPAFFSGRVSSPLIF